MGPFSKNGVGNEGSTLIMTMVFAGVVTALGYVVMMDANNVQTTRTAYRGRTNDDHLRLYLATVVDCQRTRAERVANRPTCGQIRDANPGNPRNDDTRIKLLRNDDVVVVPRDGNEQVDFGRYNIRAYCGSSSASEVDKYEVVGIPESGLGDILKPIEGVVLDCR
jgi:hypothetical protein